MNTPSEDASDASLGRVAALLAQQPDIVLAIAFGSIPAGGARPESDLDVAVLATRPLDKRRKMELISELARECGRPVDLRTAGVSILRSVLLGGRSLLCRDQAAYAGLLSRMVMDSADFLPYRQRAMRQRRNAWIH